MFLNLFKQSKESHMPKVNGKKYSYTPKGIAAAKKAKAKLKAKPKPKTKKKNKK